uniref:C2 NT-type domain-containing protein n=1 Tax=Paramoeba aestuarina TaxID=180227 RepID=A0A7S4PNQ4_9EUKA|mmetsp:Transcript_9686/g.14672  ORF Transcript_9686/g.14672 Transcript_9686/m.14672 type:complete len:403 (+) Transcript_9686:125-1333(+)
MADPEPELEQQTSSDQQGPLPEGRHYFTFFFKILRIKHVPPSFKKGDLFVKWSRGKTGGKTESVSVSDQVLTWKEPPVATFSTSLKMKNDEWTPKSITFTLKQIKKGWGTAKDVGRLKLQISEFVCDIGKTHDLVMSSTFSPPPVFEVEVSVRVDSSKQDDDGGDMSEMGDETESRTWDTVSFADLSEGEGNTNLVELRKKYDTLRRRAFQLRDALIKWQNYANKLKDNNQFLNNRISDLEKGREAKVNEIEELNKKLKALESDYEKAKQELTECEKELKDAISSLSEQKNEKSALSQKLQKDDDGEESGLAEAKGHAAKVTEVYESQTLQLQEKEKEAKKLKKLQKEKDDEIARLTASLNQSLKARSPGVHDAHSSLFKSVIALLILVLVGMLYTSMTSRS